MGLISPRGAIGLLGALLLVFMLVVVRDEIISGSVEAPHGEGSAGQFVSRYHEPIKFWAIIALHCGLGILFGGGLLALGASTWLVHDDQKKPWHVGEGPKKRGPG